MRERNKKKKKKTEPEPQTTTAATTTSSHTKSLGVKNKLKKRESDEIKITSSYAWRMKIEKTCRLRKAVEKNNYAFADEQLHQLRSP